MESVDNILIFKNHLKQLINSKEVEENLEKINNLLTKLLDERVNADIINVNIF
jgi:hypothetical protein